MADITAGKQKAPPVTGTGGAEKRVRSAPSRCLGNGDNDDDHESEAEK